MLKYGDWFYLIKEFCQRFTPRQRSFNFGKGSSYLSRFFTKRKKIFLVTISHSSTAQAVLFCCPKCLTLRGEVGGKAGEAPPVAEEANRVWRSGRLFARIRAEKDGNRKRKRDTAHDAVGSSWAGDYALTAVCPAYGIAKVCVDLYNLGYENGYNSTR